MEPLPDSASESAAGAGVSPLDELADAVGSVAALPRGPAPAGFMERVGAAIMDGAIEALLCLFVGILTGVVAAALGFGARLSLDSVFGSGILLTTLLLYS